jgi:glutathione synthase
MPGHAGQLPLTICNPAGTNRFNQEYPRKSMNLSLGVIMDPIQSIKPVKDSTFAMMLEAQRRGYEIWYMELSDLWMLSDEAWGRQRKLRLHDSSANWFEFLEERTAPLGALDAILMRKDPPFDMTYIMVTYLLDAAMRAGAVVVNPPGALRDFNEKMATTLFPQCCVPMLVARDIGRLRAFIIEAGHAVVKPVDSMGGESIFSVMADDKNLNVILETVTGHGKRYVMAQHFIPEITAGDKRILMINGTPVPYSLARIPCAGEFRGNLAAGGRGVGQPLSERDVWIANEVGTWLRENNVLFAGLDVIGDYLTEINITSPTCIRELDAQFGLNISSDLFDEIEQRCTAKSLS